MFALHLSRFFKGPPGPILQEINAWIHREPYDGVAHCLYWFFMLGFICPVIGMTLPWMLLYEMARQRFSKNRHIQPKQFSEDGGPSTQLSVVVTGCDSGIGKELALCLASEGFVVFAGCLRKESFTHFSGVGSSILPVVLDVTSDEDVAACFNEVQKWLDGGGASGKRYLHAVVNNAGVGIPGYFDWQSLSDYEHCMNGECRDQCRIS